MKMWILNLGKPINVPSLNETMAIELGANLLGEGIIFIIAAGLLFMEYSRQVRKDTAKEAARQEEISSLNYTIQELYFQAERQDAQIRELLRVVADLEGRVIQKPWKHSSLNKENQDNKSSLQTPQNINYNNYTSRFSYAVLDNEWSERNGLVLSSLAYLTNDVIRHISKSI